VGRLDQGLRDGGVEQALATEPWLASPRLRAGLRASTVDLDTVVDCAPGTARSDVVRDLPVTFDPRHRQHTWRSVVRGHVTVPNPAYRPEHTGTVDPHDPMAVFGEIR
jgi:CRISPR system Cascade subunit CasD